MKKEVPSEVTDLLNRLAKIEQRVHNLDVSMLEQLRARKDAIEKPISQKTGRVECNVDVLSRVD
jgi:hypothetical protein